MLSPSSKSMKNTKTGEEIYVFEDEDANWCVIVGTNDIKKAEKALRETEIEWYGENHEEEPLLIDDFYPATIFYGKQKNGEDGYYWGQEPHEFFEGKYEKEDGFICNLD